MLLINLKLFFRSFKNQKAFSIITTFGLVIGITGSLLIGLWVFNELSYDNFNKNAADLYVVLQTEKTPNGSSRTGAETSAPLAQTLKEDFPEVTAATRVFYVRQFLLKSKDKAFNEKHIAGVDPDFLRMFDYPLISGNVNTVLQDPSSVVLSQSTAEKYFGLQNAVGQTLSINDIADLTVTGVIQDPPANSHLRFDMLVPVNSRLITIDEELDKWYAADFCTYVLLRENTNPELFNRKIKNLLSEYLNENVNKLSLLPLTKIHTTPGVFPPQVSTIDITYVYIFTGISFLILFIACLNFINLSIARSVTRMKEIGIRKVIGGLPRQLIKQFLTESFLYATAAAGLSLLLIELLIPQFELFIRKPLAVYPFSMPLFYGAIFLIMFLSGIVSGFYPAVVMSSIKPVKIFNDWQNSGVKGSRLRKTLVVFQFTISIVLIIATITIMNQLDFIQSKKLGYDRSHLMSLPLNFYDQQFEVCRAKLLEYHGVENVTQAFCSPAEILTAKGDAKWEDIKTNKPVEVAWCTVYYDYVKTLGLQLVEGRDFSRDHVSDMGDWEKASFIVNEETVKQMGVKSAVGLNFELFGKKGPIVGVVKNFNFKKLNNKIEPLALFINPFYNQTMLIRINGRNIPETLKYIEGSLKNLIPGLSFEYHFVDDEFNQLYASENTLSGLFEVFSFLAILIACLGLFSLTSFTIKRRIKEIGIRKILGASVPGILKLFYEDFIILIIIANIIAWPAAYYFMNKWLEDFAYRIEISWWVFILSGGIALLIALATVSFQAIKAATANPVESLRYE